MIMKIFGKYNVPTPNFKNDGNNVFKLILKDSQLGQIQLQ